MLIVLNVSYGLTQVAIWTNTRSCEAVLDLAKVLVEDGNAVLTNYDSLHLGRLDLLVPLMISNFLDCEPLAWVGVQDFSN